MAHEAVGSAGLHAAVCGDDAEAASQRQLGPDLEGQSEQQQHHARSLRDQRMAVGRGLREQRTRGGGEGQRPVAGAVGDLGAPAADQDEQRDQGFRRHHDGVEPVPLVHHGMVVAHGEAGEEAKHRASLQQVKPSGAGETRTTFQGDAGHALLRAARGPLRTG